MTDSKTQTKGQIRSYEDLQVWQEAMRLVVMSYRLTRQLPSSERYTLVPQMTRAAVSVPANIAEGQGSSHRPVFLNHLSISRGSLSELETYVTLVVKLGFVKPQDVSEIRDQAGVVGRLLNGLIRALRARPELNDGEAATTEP